MAPQHCPESNSKSVTYSLLHPSLFTSILKKLTLKIKLLLHLINHRNPSITELFVCCSFRDDISPISGMVFWYIACSSNSNLAFFLPWGSHRTLRRRKIRFQSFWKKNQHLFQTFFKVYLKSSGLGLPSRHQLQNKSNSQCCWVQGLRSATLDHATTKVRSLQPSIAAGNIWPINGENVIWKPVSGCAYQLRK